MAQLANNCVALQAATIEIEQNEKQKNGDANDIADDGKDTISNENEAKTPPPPPPPPPPPRIKDGECVNNENNNNEADDDDDDDENGPKLCGFGFFQSCCLTCF